jgi:hypothetical protein
VGKAGWKNDFSIAPILIILMYLEMYFLLMSLSHTLGHFPTKTLAKPPKVLSVNHQDPTRESFVRGIIVQPHSLFIFFHAILLEFSLFTIC